MSSLINDSNSNAVQAFREPRSAVTTSLPTGVGVSMKTASLPAGIYRIFIPKTMTGIVRFASGPSATVVALATDMPRESGEYYSYINKGDALAVFDSVGGTNIELTLMP